ncbi:MAG: hypothetical protein FWD42_07160, partial [Solirubrobacterales bacterium]|nr:hypothetical protein [Solirubrobacterales bacterium]
MPLGRAVAVWATVVAVAVALVFAAGARAASQTPGWEVVSSAYPTDLKPGGTGMVEIRLFNTGIGTSNGTVTLTDTLPPGLEAIEAGPMNQAGEIGKNGLEETEEDEEEEEKNERKEREGRGFSAGPELRAYSCSGTTVITCTTIAGFKGVLRPIEPGAINRIGIKVTVASSAAGTAVNRVSASGGGAAETAESSAPFTFSSATAGFGILDPDAWITNADGSPDTQAGSHPYEASFSFGVSAGEGGPAGGALRDLQVALPPGIVGDPHALPQCTRQQFLSALAGGCPPSTQVGVDWPSLEPKGERGRGTFLAQIPVYNLVPPPGVPAEFGFTARGSNILIEAVVRSGGDYGITGRVHDLAYKPVLNTLTLWGVPAEGVHNRQRCGMVFEEPISQCGYATSAGGKPFLTMPTACEAPLSVGMSVDSWNATSIASEHGSFALHDAAGKPIAISGCEHLGFGPQLSVAPDTSYADTPAGLSVQVRMPQESLTDPTGLSTADIKNT